MRKLSVLLLLVGLIALAAFKGRPGYRLTVPAGWPQPRYNFRAHPLSEAGIDLGRRLFNDPMLSADSTISCSSCHLQYTAFTHVDHNLSHGIAGRIGTRNSPALMNLAWSTSFMWDGSVAHLDKQAVQPITNPLEMDETMDNVVLRLSRNPEYRAMFATAYGDSVVTSTRLTQALSQFMLTLVSAGSKYDRVMAGAEVFSPREQHGYQVFRTHCASCHTEPLFTNNGFENNGLPPDTALHDDGRMKITGKASDALKFKVPTLRNIEVTYPYMHDGRFRNLQMVLFHYTEGIHQSATLSPLLRTTLPLTAEDKADIVLFLKTLTDEQFLRNKNFGFANN